MSVTEYFNLIVDKQKAIGYHLPSILQKPAGKEEIFQAERKLELKFNDELSELYACANGTHNDYQTPSGSMGLIPGYAFLSLEDAISYYETSLEVWDLIFLNLDTDFKPGKKLFPFLDDNAGDCYWVDLNKGSADYGKIFWTNTLAENPGYLYNSLSSMLKVVWECYEKNVIRMDNDGFLECDYRRFGEISRDLNPGISYWDRYLR